MVSMDEATKARLQGVSTATLTTVLAKRGLRNTWLQGVAPLRPDQTAMVGPAYTLRTIPAREDLDHPAMDAGPANPQRRAIEECPAGAVFVVDSRGDWGGASAGGILATRLSVRGVAGFVTDGGLRDSPDIARLDMPAYHARPSAPANFVRHHTVEAGVPIGCGGVAVYPGDVMVGDAEGVVVVPREIAEAVAVEAQEQTLLETFIEERVAAGEGIFGLYPPSPEAIERFEEWRRARSR